MWLSLQVTTSILSLRWSFLLISVTNRLTLLLLSVSREHVFVRSSVAPAVISFLLDFSNFAAALVNCCFSRLRYHAAILHVWLSRYRLRAWTAWKRTWWKWLETARSTSHLHLLEHAASSEASSEEIIIIIIFEETTSETTPESEATLLLSFLWLSLFLPLTAEASAEKVVISEEICKRVSTPEERLEYVICVSGREPWAAKATEVTLTAACLHTFLAVFIENSTLFGIR